MLKNIIIVWTLWFPLILIGQTNFDFGPKISPDLLKKDVAILKENLELVHTGLYAYTPKSTFDQFFKNLEAKLDEPLTAIEFYRSLAPLLALIRNGHTGLVPPASFLSKIRNEWPLFPFDVYWDQGKLYVYKNMSDQEDIPQASIIQKINGEDAADVFQQLSENLTRDGYNTTALVDKANNSFIVLYLYLKGVFATYDIVVELPDGTSKEYTVQGIKLEDLKKIRSERYGPAPESFWTSDQPALEFKIEEDIATMRIRSFDRKFVKKQKKQKFKKFYKKSFQQLVASGSKNLIIDLRDNGGGDPMPTIELFAHLHPEPFTFYREVYSQVKKIPNRKLYTDLDWFTRTFHPLIFKKKGEQRYHPNWLARMLGLKGLKTSKPNTPYYDGKVYVLTNSDSICLFGCGS